MTAPTGIRAQQIQQAGQYKFLWSQGWPLQRIQDAFPDVDYSTIRRAVVGAVNKAVAPVAPEWFVNGKEE